MSIQLSCTLDAKDFSHVACITCLYISAVHALWPALFTTRESLVPAVAKVIFIQVISFTFSLAND